MVFDGIFGSTSSEIFGIQIKFKLKSNSCSFGLFHLNLGELLTNFLRGIFISWGLLHIGHDEVLGYGIIKNHFQ